MEEFDRHIKSKIDSLHEVPGVEFDEESVWKRIKSNSRSNLFFFIGLILLLISLVFIFLPKNEKKRKITDNYQEEESTSEVLIDSTDFTISQNTEENPSKIHKVERVDSVKDFQRKSSAVPIDNAHQSTINPKDRAHQSITKPKDTAHQSTPIHQAKKISTKKQTTSPVELVSGPVNNDKQEYSAAAEKDNQIIGITHLKPLQSRLSFVQGIRFNRHFNHGFRINEGLFMPFEINQIEIPIGVRYNLFKRERRFQPHLFAGVLNSFLLSSNARTMGYNLQFEVDLFLDYRIYATKEGKKGYLRFRVPLYNRDIINQGIYRPGIYNVWKR